MFKLNVLCVSLMFSSTAALLGVPFPDSFEKMMEDAARNGASESTQRTVDGFMNVSLSEKNKQRGERFSEELIQLFDKYIGEFMGDFMNEITPEDAQELLLAVDPIFMAMKQGIGFLPNVEKMSDEEKILAAAAYELHLKFALFRLVKYFPAWGKHKDVIQEKQQGMRDEAIQFTSEAIDNSYFHIRAIIEQKARS